MNPCPLVLPALLLASIAHGQGESTASIAGCVVDVDGRPIAGAAVAIESGAGPDDTAHFIETAPHRTDAAGAFSLPLPTEGFSRLTVAKAGYQAVSWGLPTDGSSLPELTLMLLPGATLCGRLRDPAGTPIAGAHVRVASSIAQGAWASRPGLSAAARSEAEGIFEVIGVPCTGMRVSITAHGFYRHEQRADQQTPLDVTLEPYRGLVRGVVLDDAGEPVPDARVGIHGASHVAEVRTDLRGRFAMGVPRLAPFQVAFSSGGVTVVGPELSGPMDGLELRPTASVENAESHELQLRITDAEGRPVAGFRTSIEIKRSDANAAGLATSRFRLQSEHEGSEAAVPLTPPNGCSRTVTVRIEADGCGWTEVEVPLARSGPVDIALPPESRIAGRVVDPQTGRPVQGAAVFARYSGRRLGSAREPAPVTTDADGRFVVRGLRAGPHEVAAHVHGRDPTPAVRAVASVAGSDPCRLEIPRIHRLRFRIGTAGQATDPTAWLSLTLDNTEGRPSHYGQVEGVAAMDRIPIRTAQAYDIEPVSVGVYSVSLHVPSRVRPELVHTFELGRIRTDEQEASLELPDATMHIVRGRAVLPDEVSSHRVALVARSSEPPTREIKAMLRALMQRDQRQLPMAALDRDGRFAIELPSQEEFTLQLVDLDSDAVFHTEPDSLTVLEPVGGLELRPEIHWLELRVDEGAPTPKDVNLYLPTVRGLWTVRRPGLENPSENETSFRWPIASRTMRLLVPEGELRVGVPGLGHRNPLFVEIREREHSLNLSL